MSQDNQFQNYGYDQYLKAPKKQRIKGAGGGNILDDVMEKLRSPVVATVALLATGALFTGVIIMAYPSKDAPQSDIPVIKADLTPIKSTPDDPGGMDVPFSDSTVLSGMTQGEQAEPDAGHIENLLAQANSDLTSKEEALQRAMGEEGAAVPQERGMYGDSSAQQQETSSAPQIGQVEGVPPVDVAAATDLVAPNADNLLQKIDPSQATEMPSAEALASSGVPAADVQKVTDTATETASASSIETDLATAATKPVIKPAATSQETMDFVRSALNEDGASAPEKANSETQQEFASAEETQDEIAAPSEPVSLTEKFETPEEPVVEAPEKTAKAEKKKPAETAQDIEPAAGVAAPSINIQPGSYYVQLASITDRSRADKEFSKLQRKFSVLQGLDFRVQEANLDKGMFYRIQAGPFSKESAKSVCDAIKEQKPGGCILVK